MNAQAPDQRAPNVAPWRAVYPSDSVGKALAYSVEQPVEPSRQNAVLRAIGQHGPEVGWWLGGVWFLLIVLVALLIGIYTDNSFTWIFYWDFALGSLALQAILLLSLWYTYHVTRRFPDGVKAADEVSVRSLRRAALTGDDALAPVVVVPGGVDERPPSLVDGRAVTFTVLPPEWRLLRGVKLTGIVSIAGFVALCALLWWMDADAATFPWDVVTFVPLGVGAGVWALLLSIRHSRALTVTVDADGLRWGKSALPWSEVRGWTVFYLQPTNTGWTHPNVVYSLIGQRASLAWLTYPPPVESDDPGKRLAQIVQARLQARGDGSPLLRDLTPGAVAISNEIGPRLSWWGTWRLVAPTDRYLRGTPLPRLPATLLTFSLAALLLLGGIFTPSLRQWYFGGQLAQLEASHSATHDPLTSDTLRWTVTPVEYEYTRPFAFTPQGYFYPAGTCCDASSLASQSLSDGLVEVTIHQQTTDMYEEAGIVFRANARDKAALVFAVSPGGYWWLNRLKAGPNGPLSQEDYLRSDAGISRFGLGRMQPIHEGRDVTNRLAVLMQGSSFTFFINGQCVGRYWGAGSDLPQTGQVGVYVGGSDSSVTFSNLLIAPA